MNQTTKLNWSELIIPARVWVNGKAGVVLRPAGDGFLVALTAGEAVYPADQIVIMPPELQD